MAKLIYGALKEFTSKNELPSRVNSANGIVKIPVGTKFNILSIVEMTPIREGGKPYPAVQCVNLTDGTFFNLSPMIIKGMYFEFGARESKKVANCPFDGTIDLWDFKELHKSKTVFEITEPLKYTGSDYETKEAKESELTTYKVSK